MKKRRLAKEEFSTRKIEIHNKIKSKICDQATKKVSCCEINTSEKTLVKSPSNKTPSGSNTSSDTIINKDPLCKLDNNITTKENPDAAKINTDDWVIKWIVT